MAGDFGQNGISSQFYGQFISCGQFGGALNFKTFTILVILANTWFKSQLWPHELCMAGIYIGGAIWV